MHVDEAIYARMGRQDREARRVPLWPLLVAAEAWDYADWYCAGWVKRQFIVDLLKQCWNAHGPTATLAAIHSVVPGATVHGDIEPRHFRRIIDAIYKLNNERT
jgi:hypothetical protein